MAFRESNALHLEILEVVPSTGVPIELDIYDGAAPATMLAHLEGAEGVKFTLTHNEEGAGQFRISRGDPKATPEIIDREHLAKVKIGGVYRFSFWMEQRRIVTLTEDEGGGEFWTISGREGTYAELDRASMDRVSHVGDDPIEGVYNLTAAGTGNKLGQMLMRVLDESLSKSPSPLEFLSLGFDYDVDSLGAAWVKDADVQVNVGTSVLPIVKMLAGLGIDLRARHDLRLNAYEELGRHFEADGGTGALVFRAGQNVTTSLERTSEPGIRSRMLVKGTGDEFFEVIRPDLEADPYVRRREGFLSFGNSADPTTVQHAGEAELDALAARRTAISFGVDHDASRGGYEPFVDYDLGDWGTLDEPGVFDMETIRIVGITVEQQEDDYAVTVDANSIVLEELLKIARRIQNGGSGGGGGGSSTSSVGGAGGGGGSITSPAKVAVEAGDLPGYLYGKLEAGDGIMSSLAGSAGNRRVRLDTLIALANLLDVDLTGIADGNGIVWNEALGLFVPGSIGGGGGGSLKDTRWTPPSPAHALSDEFSNAALDAAWTRVDNAADAGQVTWTEAADVLSVRDTGPGAPERYHALVRSLAGATFPLTIETASRTLHRLDLSYWMHGLVFSNGTVYGAGAQVITRPYLRAGVESYRVSGYGVTNWDAEAGQAIQFPGASETDWHPWGGLLYQRLIWTATNSFTFWISADGVSWIQVGGTMTRTLTPTHAGFAVTKWGGSTAPSVASYEYFRVYASNKAGGPS